MTARTGTVEVREPMPPRASRRESGEALDRARTRLLAEVAARLDDEERYVVSIRGTYRWDDPEAYAVATAMIERAGLYGEVGDLMAQENFPRDMSFVRLEGGQEYQRGEEGWRRVK